MDSSQDLIDRDIDPSVGTTFRRRRMLMLKDRNADLLYMTRPPETLWEWMVDLEIMNMAEVYDATWVWSRSTVEFDRRGGWFVVAVGRQCPVGFMHLLWEVEDAGVILTIGTIQVVPKWRRIGLGGAMVEAAIDVARHFGVGELRVMVPNACAGGLRLFRRHFFTVHRTSPGMICRETKARFKILCLRTKDFLCAKLP